MTELLVGGPAEVIIIVSLAAAMYFSGSRRLPSATLGQWRRAAFAAGLVVCVAALASPLDAAADSRFQVHMTQHMLLLLAAAPLLALGRPGLPLLLSLPHAWRRSIGRWRVTPAIRRGRGVLLAASTAWIVQTAVLWGWHLPVIFEAALRRPWLHAIEHGSYLCAGYLFWWHLTTPTRNRLEGPLAVLYIFVAALPMAAIGAVLTLAPVPLFHGQTGPGLDPLHDQQLAGLVMWAPGEAIYLAVCGAVVLGWLRRLDRSSPREIPLTSSIPLVAVAPLTAPPTLGGSS